MTDIKAYDDAHAYDLFQSLRLDYTRAIDRTIQVAKLFCESKRNICIADFCAGTGKNTRRLAQELGGVEYATLIDINAGFLATALTSEISSKALDVRKQDILTADLQPKYDLVISTFAYHHVRDEDKKRYLEIAKNCLNQSGVIVLTEIYLGTKKDCLQYYEELFASIPKERIVPGLEEFLIQTAKSTDFEFKVEKTFAQNQFNELGLDVLFEEKIWPLENSMRHDQGTFVQVLTNS